MKQLYIHLLTVPLIKITTINHSLVTFIITIEQNEIKETHLVVLFVKTEASVLVHLFMFKKQLMTVVSIKTTYIFTECSPDAY